MVLHAVQQKPQPKAQGLFWRGGGFKFIAEALAYAGGGGKELGVQDARAYLTSVLAPPVIAGTFAYAVAKGVPVGLLMFLCAAVELLAFGLAWRAFKGKAAPVSVETV